MKRVALLILTVAIMLTGSMPLTSAQTAAQAATPTPTPSVDASQALETPLDQLTLRIEEGNGYTVLTNSAGEPQQVELHQVQDGIYPEAMEPAVSGRYMQYNTQDVYITFVNLVPPGQDAAAGGVSATSVEMRVATFADTESAAGFVSTFIEDFPNQAEAMGTNPAIAPFEIHIDHDGELAGFDAWDTYYDIDTGEPLGERTYTRILMQSGAMVISVKVGGQTPELNGWIAVDLLFAQMACIEADDQCAPMPVPVEFPYSTSGVADDSSLSDPVATTATVVVANANIRATPSATGEIVGVAPSGQILTITGDPVEAEGYTWLPVTMENGDSGWVADQLVEIDIN